MAVANSLMESSCVPPGHAPAARRQLGAHPHHRASRLAAPPPGLRRPAAHHALAHLGHHSHPPLQSHPWVSRPGRRGGWEVDEPRVGPRGLSVRIGAAPAVSMAMLSPIALLCSLCLQISHQSLSHDDAPPQRAPGPRPLRHIRK